MRPKSNLIVAALRCLWPALLAAAPGCARKAEPPPPVIRPVVTMTVPAAGQAAQRAFSGAARAALQTPLSFRVGGEIIQLPARRGQSVKAGALIARLDSRDYELQAKQSEAQLAQAAAQLEQAQAQYQRARQLYETRNISKSELDANEAAFKSAQAQQELTRQALALAQQQLEYCELRAPVDGALAAVPVELHQTVAAGQTVANISAGDLIEIEVGIPEILIGQIAAGQPAEVVFEAIPGIRFAGQAAEIGIEIGAGGAYPVKVRLHQPDPRIRAGMLGEAFFDFPTGGTLRIPPAAVVPAPDGGRHVWIYNETDRTVRRRAVRIGDLSSDGLAVLDGLRPGERIVIRGVNRMEEGMRVKLME